METSVMIRQLRYTAKKHENDTLHTFDTNISAMCTDVANRLEELEKEKAEIRAEAITEFAEKLKESLTNKYRHLLETDVDGFEWLTTEAVETHIDETVKEMKGE